MSQIKVLIVDDSAFVRQSFKSILECDPGIRVIGTASDPYIAVQKIQKEKPDVITLDIEMPKMDGLTFLQKLMKQAPMPVVIISNQTLNGAKTALKALESGAVDVMEKPDLSSDILKKEGSIRLIDKVRSAYHAGMKRTKPSSSAPEGKMAERKVDSGGIKGVNEKSPHPSKAIIAVGASTGGTDAIKSLLTALPPQMPPILIVQHMPEKFTASFAKRLNECCALNVKEATHNEPVVENTVYIAPGNYHMSLIKTAANMRINISQGELVSRHRPSVNVLFNSVAAFAGENALGIILTGMGDDGATGMLEMYKKGAFTIAQDEASSVVYGMPYKAVLYNGVSRVLSLRDIPEAVVDHLKKEQ